MFHTLSKTLGSNSMRVRPKHESKFYKLKFNPFSFYISSNIRPLHLKNHIQKSVISDSKYSLNEELIFRNRGRYQILTDKMNQNPVHKWDLLHHLESSTASQNDYRMATIAGAIMAFTLSYSLVESYKLDSTIQNLSSKLNIESKGNSTYALERKEKTLENPHILLFFTLHYLDNAPSKHPKNIDLSSFASFIDWKNILKLTNDNKYLHSLVYYLWSCLVQGVDIGCSILPTIDIRPQLYKNIEHLIPDIVKAYNSEFDHVDPSFRTKVKRSYLVLLQQLSSNLSIASMMLYKNDQTEKKKSKFSLDIVESLMDIINEELIISSTSKRFLAFSSSGEQSENEIMYSSEIVLLALSSLTNLLTSSLSENFSSTRNKTSIRVNTYNEKKIPTILSNTDTNQKTIIKLTSLLRALEEQENDSHIKYLDKKIDTDKYMNSKDTIFKDRQLLWYKYFFPNAARDQTLRRGREVEAYICEFFHQLSQQRDKGLLYCPEVVNALIPLVSHEKGEGRNISAYRNALRVLKSIYIDHLNRKFQYEQLALNLQEISDSSDQNYNENQIMLDKRRKEVEQIDEIFIKAKFSLKNEALSSKLVKDKANESPEDTPYSNPNENIITSTLTSTSWIRCFTSSVTSLVVGGVYGLLRAKPTAKLDPIMIYSKAGVGALILNVLYGTYGMRNWLQKYIYIEDKHYNALIHTGLGIIDISCITSIVRQHPYSLLPFLVVNILGHNTTLGNGLKRLDGLDCMFSLD